MRLTLLALLMFVAVGCGSGQQTSLTNTPGPTLPSGSPAPTGANISVAISPASAQVEVGKSQQYSAAVTNDASGRGVIWRVVSCSGEIAGSACGFVDSTGKYTAPVGLGLVSRNTVTLQASTIADPSKIAFAEAVVVPVPTGATISPLNVYVQNGGVVKFTAVVNPAGASQSVEWSLSGPGCSGASCGSIDVSGQYTAPSTSPSPAQVSVTAVPSGHPEAQASATALIEDNAENGKLEGRYAFLLNGYDGDGYAATAGSFVADGKGQITSGVLDRAWVIGVSTGDSFTGSYFIGPDNRGSIVLNTNRGNYSFSVALNSISQGVARRGRLVDFEDHLTATGWLAKQDPAGFADSAISGGYAFRLTGQGTRGTYLMAVGGRFTANAGSITDGQADIDNGGLGLSTTPFAGSYSVDATGRGTVVLPLGTFVSYVISSDELILMQIHPSDWPSTRLNGIVLRQSGGPFTNASLSGPAVLNLSAENRALIARMDFDGNGNIAGSYDEMIGEIVSVNDFPLTGNYQLDPNGLGRGTLQLIGDAKSYVLYSVAPGIAFVIDSSTRSGKFEAQAAGPFGTASLNGVYSIASLPMPQQWVNTFFTGSVTADGNGSLSGTRDGLSTGQTLNATYSVAANGRVSMNINGAPQTRIFYIVSPAKIIGVASGQNLPDPSKVSTFTVLEK
jgi:hypothetical protein